MSLSVGKSDEWYTPPYIFDALKMEFDLDPCSPGAGHWVPAKRVYTKADDGLNQPWSGEVFVNPPFGGRNGHITWIEKFILHGHGIMIVSALTSSGWFHDYAAKADAICFPKGKTKFIRADGSSGGQPWHGIALLACGPRSAVALKDSKLGIFFLT